MSGRIASIYNACFGTQFKSAGAIALAIEECPDQEAAGRFRFVLNVVALEAKLRGAYWVDRDLPEMPPLARTAVEVMTKMRFLEIDPSDGQAHELWLCRADMLDRARLILAPLSMEESGDEEDGCGLCEKEVSELLGLPVANGAKRAAPSNTRVSIMLRRKGWAYSAAVEEALSIAAHPCENSAEQMEADEVWRARWAELVAKEMGGKWCVVMHRRVVGFAVDSE